MSGSAPEVSFLAVERVLRRSRFATLASLTEEGRPHATGVVYAVSPPDESLCCYVTTNATNKKVANVRTSPDVALVVPIRWAVLGVLPPVCIQFQGTAEVVEATDPAAVRHEPGCPQCGRGQRHRAPRRCRSERRIRSIE